MVYNNLAESPYKFEYGKLTFIFSSNFYKEKFIKEFQQFVHNETLKLKVKFKCNILCDEMAMLLLYKKIEKRGFMVLYEEKELNENYIIDFNINILSFK